MTIETHKGQGSNENTSSLVEYIKNKGFNVKSLDGNGTGYIWAWNKGLV